MKGAVKLVDVWKILIVGNNPIELSRVNDWLHGIRQTVVRTELAFDTESIFQRLITFSPKHILMDDNMGKPVMRQVVARLQRHAVPITVLKNSNYEETIGTGVTNFLLKQNLTSELLYRELLNSMRFQESQASRNRLYGKRTGQLARILGVAEIQI